MGMTSFFNFFIDGLNGVIFFKGIATTISLPQWIYTNADLASLIPAVLIVGGLIIITLSYVSFRKYKAEKEHKRKKRDKLVD